MPTLNLAPATSEDYRRIAEKRLPRFFFDYVDGGAYQERTMAANVADFEAPHLHTSHIAPRPLCGSPASKRRKPNQ